MSAPAGTVRFLVLTYAFTWSFCLFGFLLRDRALIIRWSPEAFELPFFYFFIWIGGLGPGVVALILSEEKEEPSGLWGLLTKWRVRLVWYLVALLLPVFMCGVAVTVYYVLGGILIFPDTGPLWFLDTLAVVVLAPFWEELGWRGFLLPKLLQVGSSIRASLIIGAVWGLWHLPVRWHTGPVDVSPLLFFLIFWITVVGLSFAFTRLFELTYGALLPCMLLHASYNAAVACFIAPTIQFFGIGLLVWFALTVWCGAFILHRWPTLPSKTMASDNPTTV